MMRPEDISELRLKEGQKVTLNEACKARMERRGQDIWNGNMGRSTIGVVAAVRPGRVRVRGIEEQHTWHDLGNLAPLPEEIMSKQSRRYLAHHRIIAKHLLMSTR
eukprot:COSAG05_NODE_2950_length_2473_cov_60.232098_4_plen_105_part_00